MTGNLGLFPHHGAASLTGSYWVSMSPSPYFDEEEDEGESPWLFTGSSHLCSYHRGFADRNVCSSQWWIHV